MHSAPTPASIQNSPCHPVKSTSRPPSNGPAAAPTAAAAPHKDTARSCASPSLATERRLSPQARMVAPAAPWMTRPAITIPPDPASAIITQDATNSRSPSWKTRLRPNTSPSEPEVTMTAAPTNEYPVTAHCRVSTEVPVSAEMAGSRMLTADVFAFTTSVEMQVTVSTPPALLPTCATSLIRVPSVTCPDSGAHAATLGRGRAAALTRYGRVPSRPRRCAGRRWAESLTGPRRPAPARTGTSPGHRRGRGCRSTPGPRARLRAGRRGVRTR